MKHNRKIRKVSLYYRDENKIMRKVPLVKLLVFNEKNGGKTAMIFTEHPLDEQKIDLN